MASSFKLALQIGATVGRSFRTAIKGSQTQLNELGASLNQLRDQQAAVRKFELTEANVGKARVAYNAAVKELVRLRQEMARTEQPSQRLTQAFETARQRTERLSRELATQRERLQNSRRAVEQTGMSTSHLARDNVRLGETVDQLSRKYSRLSQTLRAQQAVSARQADLRGQLFDAAALGASVVAPLRIAIDFEQSIATLGAITRASEEDINRLETEARRLGESTLFTASQSAEAMTFLGKAGFDTNKILAATPGVLNLAQAAGNDLGETADIATNILSSFSLKAEDMADVGNILTATFTSSNTTLHTLGETMKYAGTVASGTGASLKDVAAMAGLLGSVAIDSSMAGTALRAAFIRLSAPPTEAAKALDRLGLSVKDSEGNLRPMVTILRELSEATQDMGTAERLEVISKIFGMEAASAIAELLRKADTNAIDEYIAKLEKASQNNITDTIAQQMGDTTLGALRRLGSALESVAISFGSVLLPTIASGATVLAGMASWVSSAAQEYPLLTKVIVGATVGLIALRVVTIAGAFAFTFLKGGVLSLLTAYQTLGAGLLLIQTGMARMNVLSALSAARLGVVTAAQWALNIAMTANPIGLIVAGIAALAGAAYLLIRYWEPIGDFFSHLWESIKTFTADAVKWLLEHIQLLFNPLELLGTVWKGVSDLFQRGDEREAPVNNPRRTLAKTAVGTALATQPALAAPTATLNALPQIEAVSMARPTDQSVRIEAPITINAQPGMDERAIAVQVRDALTEAQVRAQAEQRAALFDT